MRLHAVIAITSIIALPINADRAFAQFNYGSQNRSISVDAIVPSSIPPVEDMKSSTAPDFTDFVKSLSASATSHVGGSTATANTSQQSQLESTSITASGSVSDKGFRSYWVRCRRRDW